jgi:opacity protein-like surface antigen
MMLYAVLSLVALASIVAAWPVNQGRTVRIRGTPRNNLFQRADGTLDYNVLKADILKTKAKYSKQGNKRSVGTEVLTDDISGGIDVGYYGPISVGTPAQTIRRYPILLSGHVAS